MDGMGIAWLTMAIALTGVLALMPYIALQLVGIKVVIAAMGVAWRVAAGGGVCDSGGLYVFQRAAGAGGDCDCEGRDAVYAWCWRR